MECFVFLLTSSLVGALILALLYCLGSCCFRKWRAKKAPISVADIPAAKPPRGGRMRQKGTERIRSDPPSMTGLFHAGVPPAISTNSYSSLGSTVRDPEGRDGAGRSFRGQPDYPPTYSDHSYNQQPPGRYPSPRPSMNDQPAAYGHGYAVAYDRIEVPGQGNYDRATSQDGWVVSGFVESDNLAVMN
jgi:hypothetical protein